MRIKDFINEGGLVMNKAAGCFCGFTADKLTTKLNLSGGFMKSCVDVNMYLWRYIDSNNRALFAQVLVAPHKQQPLDHTGWSRHTLSSDGVDHTYLQTATGGRYI